MKKLIFAGLVLTFYMMACDNKSENKTEASGDNSSSITLPYVASYATTFTNDVPDSSLLLVLNSYKYWENGDIKALRSTMGDSMYVDGSDGFKFKGHTDSLVNIWLKARDSLSSVVIKMDVWLKNHSVADTMDYINVWYKEIDTYKSGKIDSANYEDDNGLKDGKIIWYSSHKQKL
ncbi:MAG: hypothetical protein ABI594_06840 [Ginsengibacter sp.]